MGSYLKFNGISSDEFYNNNTIAKKLFDVNQHAILDSVADHNSQPKEEIIQILKELFKQNNVLPHFQTHWKIENN
ncbi:hypothetical protein [Stenoxybacter acetivorans]|uniref:hypothetical protein n=1 Tax=Stenoxybacter acetivorans TaxID=422441 RepID=UPI0012EC2FE3|nr:hypothetical protein [Stenoxybacter acetivorans]